MVLRITDSQDDFGIGAYVISLDNFRLKEFHPMIATTKWDEVYIDLGERTPKGIIKQLIHSTRVIPVFDKANVTPSVLQLLCEICPDEAAKLRAYYIKDKTAFNKLLVELSKVWQEEV